MVFKILEGWLVIKESIIPLLAAYSHKKINAIKRKICVKKIHNLFLFLFFK